MYNKYYKKDIIVPKSNILNKKDIKLKDKSYDNIRDIVIIKKDIEIPENNSKNKYKIF